MKAKFSLALFLSITTMALVTPMANASTLTQGGGVVPVPSTIKGDSASTVVVTETLGVIGCGKVTTVMPLKLNSGGRVVMEGGSGVASICNLNGLNPITVTNMAVLLLQFSSPITGGAILTFESDLPGGLVCHFEGLVHATYTPGSSSVFINGLLEGGLCGESEISSTMFLSSGGFALTLDA